MRYYFEERTNKKFVGRRTTIATTINEDIRGTKEKHTNFPITPLISLVNPRYLQTEVKNRKLWQKVVIQVADSAYSL